MHRVQLEFSETPITAASRITIDADSSCARKLPNLKLFEAVENDDNGNARLGIDLHLWMATFAARLRVGPAAQDQQAAARANPFTARLTQARMDAWMATLEHAGVFDDEDTAFDSDDELHAAIRDADITIAECQVLAADWSLGEAFDVPTGGGAAASRAREALTPLRFISLASVLRLEDADDELPWAALCSIMGAVGSYFTRQSRVVETTSVQTFAALFRAFHSECTTDATLALALRHFASSCTLPSDLLPATMGAAELQSAAVDGINYNVVSRRRKIEERRIVRLLDQVPTPHADIPQYPHM